MIRPPVFDFASLDGLAFAAERGRFNGPALPRMAAQGLGPILELAQLADTGLLPAPEKAEWLALDGFEVLYRMLLTGRSQWVCADGRRIGFLRTGAQPPKNETGWISFCLAAQQAASMAGFPTRIAQQLIAAIGELRSNVYEHSRSARTGLIAFRAGTSSFEFVVGDRGVGVLQSLRTCTEFEGISDHGEALKLALTEGVSRFGSKARRGYGFRPIFVGLANVRGYLRFRSGDHSLIIDGTRPSLTTARPAQKPMLSGFIVSVSCNAALRSSRCSERPILR
jgi:anti-sigma regulatory factor (Ser/Thr protein kinase)